MGDKSLHLNDLAYLIIEFSGVSLGRFLLSMLPELEAPGLSPEAPLGGYLAPRLGGEPDYYNRRGLLQFCGDSVSAFCMPGFHPSLEDEDGGHAVDGFAALLDGEVGFAEETIGFGGGEALVPKVNGKVEALAKVVGEGVDFFGLNAFGTTHAERESNDDFFDVIFADDAVEELEIVFLVFAVEGFESLGGDAERIGDGDADAAGADVEAEDAGVGHGEIISFGLSASGSRLPALGFRLSEDFRLGCRTNRAHEAVQHLTNAGNFAAQVFLFFTF